PRNTSLVRGHLGSLLLQRGQWMQSLQATQDGLEAAHRLMALALDPETREHEIGSSEDLYANCAYAYARLGDTDEALRILEEGRARELRYRSGRDQAELGEVSLGVREAFKQAAQRLRELEVEWRQPLKQRAEDLAERNRQAWMQFEAAKEKIRTFQPDFLRDSIALADIRTTVSNANATLVELAVTEAGTVAFVLSGDQHSVEALWFDELTRRRLW